MHKKRFKVLDISKKGFSTSVWVCQPSLTGISCSSLKIVWSLNLVFFEGHFCYLLIFSAHHFILRQNNWVSTRPPVEIRRYISVFPSVCLRTVPTLPPLGVTASASGNKLMAKQKNKGGNWVPPDQANSFLSMSAYWPRKQIKEVCLPSPLLAGTESLKEAV